MSKSSLHILEASVKEAFIQFILNKGYHLLTPTPPYEVIRATNYNLTGHIRTIVVYRRAKEDGFYTIQPQTKPLFDEFFRQHISKGEEQC